MNVNIADIHVTEGLMMRIERFIQMMICDVSEYTRNLTLAESLGLASVLE